MARANHAGCLDQCEHGPIVVIYPQGIWYGRSRSTTSPESSPDNPPGEVLEDLLIAEECLNESSDAHIAELRRVGPSTSVH